MHATSMKRKKRHTFTHSHTHGNVKTVATYLISYAKDNGVVRRATKHGSNVEKLWKHSKARYRNKIALTACHMCVCVCARAACSALCVYVFIMSDRKWEAYFEWAVKRWFRLYYVTTLLILAKFFIALDAISFTFTEKC